MVRPSSSIGRLLAAAFFLAFLATAALADIVHLKNGGRIEGKIVRETATEVHLRTGLGSVMRIPKSRIKRIEKKTTVYDEYARRRAALKRDDAKGLFALYQWCVKNRLKLIAADVLDEVLRADPNHPEAHKMKGHVLVNERWLTPDQAKKAGYHLHEGKWLTYEQMMKAKGFVRWGKDWIPETEYDRQFTKTKMEQLLQMELTVENSEHFGVRTRFPKEHATRLLELAEKAYLTYMKILPYSEKSLRKWRRIEIYLFANLEEYQIFMDRYIWAKKYITDEDLYLHYREAGNCNYYFPRPIVGLRQSAALPKFNDQATLAIHNVGHVLLHRMRREIYPPDWLEEGLAHYVEEQVMGYCRIFCMMPGKLSRRELIVPGWRNSQQWKKQMRRILVTGEVPHWKRIMKKPLGAMNTKELAKVYAVVRMIIKQKPEGLKRFIERAKKHSWEEVFEETIGWSPEQVDTELARFINDNY